MKTYLYVPVFTFLLIACGNGDKTNSEIIQDDSENVELVELTEIDSNYCNCNELIFDEPYNHFFRFERREGFTGKCEDFHSNGEKKMEKNFVDGKLHGKFFLYYDNGQIEEEKEFDNNFQTGEQITYSKKGEVIFHALYKRGTQTKVLVTRPDIPKIDPWEEAQ